MCPQVCSPEEAALSAAGRPAVFLLRPAVRSGGGAAVLRHTGAPLLGEFNPLGGFTFGVCCGRS